MQTQVETRTVRPRLAAVLAGLAIVTLLPLARILAADAPGAMSVPPPMKDPLLTSWQGTWEGDTKMGDKSNLYTEIVFAPTVGAQWLEGRMHVWTDKTKKSTVMDYAMFLRPSGAAGTYKAVGVSSDGSGSTATITTAGGVQTWTWNNDNDTKETATLTQVTPDHVVYEGSITDKTGAKLMDIKQDLTKRMPAATASHTPKKK